MTLLTSCCAWKYTARKKLSQITFNQINSMITFCNQVFPPTFSISVLVKWGRRLINVYFFTQQLQLLFLFQDSVHHIYILKYLCIMEFVMLLQPQIAQDIAAGQCQNYWSLNCHVLSDQQISMRSRAHQISSISPYNFLLNWLVTRYFEQRIDMHHVLFSTLWKLHISEFNNIQHNLYLGSQNFTKNKNIWD